MSDGDNCELDGGRGSPKSRRQQDPTLFHDMFGDRDVALVGAMWWAHGANPIERDRRGGAVISHKNAADYFNSQFTLS
jgi:hypothetical protein